MKLIELYEQITPAQLSDIEKFAERLWSKIGVDIKFTKHFLDRANDDRNGKPISGAELVRLFKKEYEKYGDDIKSMSDQDEAVMVDLLTDLNLPFVMLHKGTGQELFAKTVLRTKAFHGRTRDRFKVH